jgi:uncharacterized membrane-anchored protein
VQQSLGLLLVLAGVVLLVVGLLVLGGGLGWFGNLPGDLRWEGERSRVYLPITSMILVSVVLTLVLTVLRRFL